MNAGVANCEEVRIIRCVYFRRNHMGVLGMVIINPTDFEEIVNVNLAKETGTFKFAHMQGYGKFLAAKSKDAKTVNLHKRQKRMAIR